jgi:superfamily II DNA or RNA helicase
MELGNQAEFLGIMTRTEMLATFFVHDGSDTSKWRLKGHAEDKFWSWMATWAIVLTNPADLGYPSDGYNLPRLNLYEHIVQPEINTFDGNYIIIPELAKTLTERREARRNSLTERCKKAAELVAEKPDEQWLIWCDLNDESGMLHSLINGSAEVRGSYDPDKKADALKGFSDGSIRHLVTKPSIAGFGLNWQGCHNMIFVGLSDSYEMMYQAIRRCYRFGQEETVNVHIVTSEAEGAVKENIERKERQSELMTVEMVKHTKEILEAEIRGTTRITIPYNPQTEMTIPQWLIGAA